MAEYVHHLREIVGGGELLQIPSVSVALRDGDGRVLLARHVEGNVWLLPGGAVEPGEAPADAAVREMWEETGLLVRLTGLIGVFGGPEFIVQYRNGHRTSYVTSTFEAALDGGSVRPDSSEVLEVRFVSEAEAQRLPGPSWMAELLPAIFRSTHRSQAFRRPTWKPPETAELREQPGSA